MEATMIGGAALPVPKMVGSVFTSAGLTTLVQPDGQIAVGSFIGRRTILGSSQLANISGNQLAMQVAQQALQTVTLGQPFTSTGSQNLSNAALGHAITIDQVPGAPSERYSIYRAYLNAYNRAQALSLGSLTPTGTVPRPWRPIEVPPQPRYYSPAAIVAQGAVAEQIFETVQAFYLSANKPRDRHIAERITTLYRAALEEDEHILPASLNQFTQFFLANKGLGFPRITLTPDGTIRVRWIRGDGDFVAVEFTGEPDAKLVTEMPGLVPPMRFSREPLVDVIAVVKALGGSFA